MNRMDDLSDKVFQQKLRNDFVRDGFVFIPGFLNEEAIKKLKARVGNFIETRVKDMPKQDVYYEDINDKSTLKQLQQLSKYDPYFYDMLIGSSFQQLASILLNDEVHGKNMQYFNKPPKIGQRTPPHQDGYYFMLEPSEAVTMWMPLEAVDEENGCVRYIRNSHTKGMRPHGRTATLGFSQGITDYGKYETKADEEWFPTKAGDLLVHHALTIHRADSNKSKNRTRKALGLIYYADKAREDMAAHEVYARKLAEDLSMEEKI